MDRSDVTLERMRSFVRVAERGSLSAVARELGVGQSTVTRHLRELEQAVGVPLLSRTTRRVAIALRLGPLADSSMKLRALGVSRRLLVAAPDYLAARGRPVAPRDLAGHEGIRMSNVAGSDMLAFQGPGGERHAVPFSGRLRV